MKAEGKIYICGHQAATFPTAPIFPISPTTPIQKFSGLQLPFSADFKNFPCHERIGPHKNSAAIRPPPSRTPLPAPR